MRSGTRPAIILRTLDHPGTYRVAFHIPHRRPQISFIQWRRKKPPLPEVPLPTPRTVNPLGVTHMQRLEYPVQSVIGCRNGNQVNMVGHEAIGEYFNLKFLAIFMEPSEIRLTIFVRKENIFASITALRDVVWNTSKYRSG